MADDLNYKPGEDPERTVDHASVVYDRNHGPYAISLHATTEDAARSAALAGFGLVARWAFGVDLADAIREWESSAP